MRPTRSVRIVCHRVPHPARRRTCQRSLLVLLARLAVPVSAAAIFETKAAVLSISGKKKKLDPEKDTTKRLVSGVQKQDPKITAKAVLDLADDLDVAAFSSAGTGQPALRSI